MAINIRKYQRSDYNGLIALLGKEYKSNISQQVLEKNYISSSKTILIADDNGRVAGCTFVELQTDYIRPRRIAYVTYVAVDQNAIAKMPEGYDFNTAAAIPLTGLTAYQARRGSALQSARNIAVIWDSHCEVWQSR